MLLGSVTSIALIDPLFGSRSRREGGLSLCPHARGVVPQAPANLRVYPHEPVSPALPASSLTFSEAAEDDCRGSNDEQNQSQHAQHNPRHWKITAEFSDDFQKGIIIHTNRQLPREISSFIHHISHSR